MHAPREARSRERARGRFSLLATEGAHLPTPRSWTSGLHNCETRNHWVCGALFQQPWETPTSSYDSTAHPRPRPLSSLQPSSWQTPLIASVS